MVCQEGPPLVYRDHNATITWTIHPMGASQLDIQEQGSLSRCVNCGRAVWISGGTESHAATPKAASEADSAGPGAPESAAVKGRLEEENEALMKRSISWSGELRCSSNDRKMLFAELQHGADWLQRCTQVGHRCKDLQAHLGQRPTSLIQCQKNTQDTRSRLLSPVSQLG
ncbi:uncharacterized protein LOC125879011 [Epinephelus fuscoguttatus]|uniref:uncharacterized protein LOC125879011 n=1 Tax=Epinephelus fuscoguttatus TaxID=293821 RepID=UPI0020D0F615|nr:uncharacterized protein LOC125879011 [Epinephelus fuscoguttatus]